MADRYHGAAGSSALCWVVEPELHATVRLRAATASAAITASGRRWEVRGVTLTWWTGQAADAEKILEGLAADFHDQHPNVTIEVSAGAPTADDLLAEAVRRLRR